MGKFLSYYKFTPSKWLSGEITLCSYETKGMFIDLCSLFWAKEGVLKEAFVEQMLNKCSPSVKQELFDLEIVSYQNGLLHIDFLINQLEEFEGISEKRAEAGRKSAEIKRNKKQKSTSVQQKSTSVQQDSTIKRREEKRKEDNIREEEIRKDDKEFANIIEDLNIICKTNYKHTTPKTKELIKTRLKEGFTEEDFYKVHRNMFNCWFYDSKMREYLRPITLYGTKFESYLNRPQKTSFDHLSETTKKNMEVCSNWLKKQEVSDVG